MNICAECKYYSQERTMLQGMQGGSSEPQCKHHDAASRDPVSGVAYCRQERAVKGKSGCGKTGKLWEARPSK